MSKKGWIYIPHDRSTDDSRETVRILRWQEHSVEIVPCKRTNDTIWPTKLQISLVRLPESVISVVVP